MMERTFSKLSLRFPKDVMSGGREPLVLGRDGELGFVGDAGMGGGGGSAVKEADMLMLFLSGLPRGDGGKR